MDTNQYNQFRCKHNTSLNTVDEKIDCQRSRCVKPCNTVLEKTCCVPTTAVTHTSCGNSCGKTNCPTPKKVSTCCTTKPPSTPCIDPCKNLKCSNQCYDNFCTKVKKECETFDESMFGNNYTSKMGKVMSICDCIKFNGLQDTCKHPGCCSKKGCMDNPYPTCPPAQKWKCNYMCKTHKKPCNDS